jgi:hypothetical protein
MVYDTPALVANHLRQSSLYNPTWNTQKHLHAFISQLNVLLNEHCKESCYFEIRNVY